MAAGVGVNYSYYGYGRRILYIQTILCWYESFWEEYIQFQQLFIQVQPELNYMWASQVPDNGQNLPELKVNQFVPSLLMGGGAAIPTGCKWRYYDQRHV
ncbi:MAG: hypothetical protein WDM78_10295 [Puia sp.]